MRNHGKLVLFGWLLCALLAACAPTAETVSVPATRATATAVPATAQIAMPSPSPKNPTPTETAVRPLETAVVTTTPRPTQPIPTAAPTADLDAARAALPDVIQAESVPNEAGYPLVRIRGGEYGFRSAYYCDGPFRWLDETHLLLYPIIGHTTWFENSTGGKITLPVVWDLSGANAPWTTSVATDRCKLPVYSAPLRRLIDVQNGRVQLFTLAGAAGETYGGAMPLALAPSGLRLLAGYTWIDLETGAMTPLQPGGGDRYLWNPTWSADERLLAQCCLSFGDAATGELWQPNTIDGIFFGGMGIGPGGRPGGGEHFVRNAAGELRGLLFESSASFTAGGLYNPVPLIDPETRTYIDLRPSLGLTDENMNCGVDVAPDSAHMWVQCQNFESGAVSDSLLVDLVSDPFSAQAAFSGTIETWSPDGRFLVYWQDVARAYVLLDVQTGAERVLIADPGDSTWVFRWSPDGARLSTWLPASQTLAFYDVAVAASWQVTLPATLANWRFAPDGAQVVVQDVNGRLWLTSSLAEAEMRPLTPALGDLHSLRWSPDGSRIAAAAADGLYIVALHAPSE